LQDLSTVRGLPSGNFFHIARVRIIKQDRQKRNSTAEKKQHGRKETARQKRNSTAEKKQYFRKTLGTEERRNLN